MQTRNDILSPTQRNQIGWDPFRFLQRLVKIDSGTLNVIGVQEVQSHVAEALLAMGFVVERKKAHKEFAESLFAVKKGSSKKTVTLIMHADTVRESREFDKDYYLKLEGSKFYAPGAIDNKGGIVVALDALNKFLGQIENEINVQVVCVANEEMGSQGFRGWLKEIGESSDLLLGFEPSATKGAVIQARSGNRWYDVGIRGIEAHSGRAAGEELNAAHHFTQAITEILNKKSDYEDIKFNVTALKASNEKYNIVCGDVSAKLDFRFKSNRLRDEFHKHIAAAFCANLPQNNKGEPLYVSLDLVDDCPAMRHNPSGDFLISKVCEFLSETYGEKIESVAVSGAADINYMYHESSVAIDGLGPQGGGMHTDKEFIDLTTVERRSQSVSQFLKYVNNPSILRS